MNGAALDFWIGEWDCVFDGGTAVNRISWEYGGNVVTERFEALTPKAWSGMSVSVFDDKLGVWRQTWVDDNANYWHFVGVDVDDGPCFATPEPVDTDHEFKRMMFTDITNAGFDWRWESSPDGRTWTRNWSIRYARRV